MLIYVPDVTRAASEMKRVLRAGGHVACIEPDISTSTINLANRSLVRRVMGNEADSNVAHGWLPGELGRILKTVGFSNIHLATRVVVFSPELAVSYFSQCGHSAAANGVISDSEVQYWTSEIRTLANEDRIFASVGYFLFTAQA
jgi:hypothetical protein